MLSPVFARYASQNTYMIEFFPQFQSTFAHFSNKLPTWVSFCSDGVSFCPEFHPQPLFLFGRHTSLWGFVRTQNTPTPPQNTPFPGLNLKMGKMNYRLGSLDPNWAKCLKLFQK